MEKNVSTSKTREIKIELTDAQKEQIIRLIDESKSTNFNVEIQFKADITNRTIVPATVMVGMAV